MGALCVGSLGGWLLTRSLVDLVLCQLSVWMEPSWSLEALNEFISVDVFLFHDLLLNLFREEALECVWLYLKVFIEILNIPDVVVDQLRLLLLLRELYLSILAMHT
jgi:hypothetical protein